MSKSVYDIVLNCMEEDCGNHWIDRKGVMISEATDNAIQCGWTIRHMGNICPFHSKPPEPDKPISKAAVKEIAIVTLEQFADALMSQLSENNQDRAVEQVAAAKASLRKP